MLAMALTLQAPNLDTEDTCQLATHLVYSGQHKDNPSLLALWMLWAGVPTLRSSSAYTTPSTQIPVLVEQEVFQLLMMSGLFTADCLTDAGPNVGVHCVAEKGTSGLLALEREESVKMLLDSGVSLNHLGSIDGQTVLATAALEGSANVANLLLAHGLDPMMCDHQGQTPLILASKQGHVTIISVLLEWAKSQEAETAVSMLEHVDSEGWTALRSAAWGGT